MNIEHHNFPNFGYLTARLSNDSLKQLASVIDRVNKSPEKFDNYADRLVANIKHSYDLVNYRHTIEQDILELIKEYDKRFPGYLMTQDLVNKRTPIGISDLWVNFQKPGDFNPNHYHTGIFSFVIWMFIPYVHEEQNKDVPGAGLNGCFEFSYVQTNGSINHVSLNADKTWNGICCFFPSSFQHCVYPYSSDTNKSRITVSGNVRYLLDS